MKVGEVIRSLRKANKLTQADLAAKLGVAPTAVSAWERNENRPLMDKISILAELFGVPVTRFFEVEEFGGQIITDTAMIPIVGRVSCGNGALAYEDIEGYEATPSEWLNGGEYFYLRAKGDSMINARIQDGDLLLIRKQDEVENGEIAAVLIGEDAVLKKVYSNGSQLVLQSENPKYDPIFAPPAVAKVIGKLKMVTIKF